MKPKSNKKGDPNKSKKYDRCQTPWYAVDPLLPYLKPKATIWESAAGDGQMGTKLLLEGFDVVETDILTGQNFFQFQPAKYHMQVTNPPYSIKYKWLRRCYDLGKPFALLMPVETMGAATAQLLFDDHGIEIILLDKRVNFKMPNIGYGGKGSQFPVAWYTWGLKIGKQLTFGHISYYEDGQRRLIP